jgi:hypothetical protein
LPKTHFLIEVEMIALLGSIWPFLLAGGGILFGLFAHLSAKSTKAAADQKVAEAQTVVAQAQTQTAQVHDAAAQANATAAQAGAQALKERENVETAIASQPAGDAAKQLLNGWTRD